MTTTTPRTCPHRATLETNLPGARFCKACGQLVPKGRNKFNAQRTERDGIWFDSGAEAARYDMLRARQLAGEIRDLTVHPPFRLGVGGVTIGAYVADFQYVETATGRTVAEDVKGGTGTQTALYRWKLRHARTQYFDVRFVEVRA